MIPTHAPGRLSSPRLVAYLLPSLVTSVTALPLALFIPALYADDLGVPLAAVGAAIALSRLLDAINPVVRARPPLTRPIDFAGLPGHPQHGTADTLTTVPTVEMRRVNLKGHGI